MKSLILSVLENRHSPIKRKELLEIINRTYSMTDRAMRKLIEELVAEGNLISSSERGYSLIRTIDEVISVNRYLRKKIFPLFERCKSLNKAWNVANPNNPIPERNRLQYNLFD